VQTETERIEVRFRDRQTGEILVEQIPAEAALRWLYQTPAGRLFLGPVFGSRVLSCLWGWWQNRSWTRGKIRPFVERFQIDLEEMELPLDRYPSFNAFFTRRLKPGTRPFVPEPEALCSPADGKALVYPCLTGDLHFPLKGSSVTPASLLDSKAASQTYEDGSALVVRLAPPDYHRFHFPDHGQAGPARFINGWFHSVNPVALTRVSDLFHLNQRAVTEIDTARFGRIAYVEIGAFAVGRIVQTFTPGPVHRGQEKGYFQIGASTLVLLFAPGTVVFDEDLVRASAAGLEAQVRTGSRVGRSA